MENFSLSIIVQVAVLAEMEALVSFDSSAQYLYWKTRLGLYADEDSKPKGEVLTCENIHENWEYPEETQTSSLHYIADSADSALRVKEYRPLP